jgi:hypothetical protein
MPAMTPMSSFKERMTAKEEIPAGTLDLMCRKILMSAHLYYDRSSPVLSDAEFDQLCETVVKNWDRLDSMRQWQLGDKNDLKASGMHVKLTLQTVKGAEAWHMDVFGKLPESHYNFFDNPLFSDYWLCSYRMIAG